METSEYFPRTFPRSWNPGWAKRKKRATFYPFLVVLEGGAKGKQLCWMPYWHVVGKEARYGQHAVCLDHAQFDSLIEQAKDNELEPALECV